MRWHATGHDALPVRSNDCRGVGSGADAGDVRRHAHARMSKKRVARRQRLRRCDVERC